MGFRLSVMCKDNKDVKFYGTELYGYVKHESKLKSWKYLKGLGKLDEIGMGDEDTWWDEYVGDIELSEKEFELFIEYYVKDLIDNYDYVNTKWIAKKIYPILKEPGGKIVSWV